MVIYFPQLFLFPLFLSSFSKRSFDFSHEVNLSVRQSGFTIYRRYKPEKENEILVKAGSPLRLFHKEIEAYLTCEGLFGEEVTENGEYRLSGDRRQRRRQISCDASLCNASLFSSSSTASHRSKQPEDVVPIDVRHHVLAVRVSRWDHQRWVKLEATLVDIFALLRSHSQEASSSGSSVFASDT